MAEKNGFTIRERGWKKRERVVKKSLSEESLVTKILVCNVYGAEMVANMRK